MRSSSKAKRNIFLGILVTTLFLTFAIGTASAEKSITLNVGSTWAPIWPNNHIQMMWEKKVTKATNGRIKFKNFWGGSLVKMGEETDALESGTIDMAVGCNCFYPTDMPLNNIYWGLIFITPDPVKQLKIYRKLREEYPMVQETEKHNCKLLFQSCGDTYGLFSKTPIRTVADIKGKKISGIGRYHPRFFKCIGTELISMHVGDRYNALATGVLDADYLPFIATKPYRYWEVAPYRILTDSGSNFGLFHAMSLNAWNRLSKEDQKLLLDLGQETEMEGAEWTATEYVRFQKELKEKEGVTFIKFPEEEKIKWCKAIGDVIWDYARDVEKAGQPGFEFVKAYARISEELGFRLLCDQLR